MLKIATWNVNSVRARLPNILTWLNEAAPDIVLLQEIKCVYEAFPRLDLQALGYVCAVHGQKSYNGVAILSRLPIRVRRRGLPTEDGCADTSDGQARYLEACIAEKITVASLYLPNGNPTDTEKFRYKLRWMDRLIAHAKRLKAENTLTVLGGDYNICPTDDDVYDPQKWNDDALCHPEGRSRFHAVLHDGWTEAYRALNRQPNRYSFWDYQGGAWQKDNGLRIDHILLSPKAADRLTACDIDRRPRGCKKASDHTPVWCEIDV